MKTLLSVAVAAFLLGLVVGRLAPWPHWEAAGQARPPQAAEAPSGGRAVDAVSPQPADRLDADATDAGLGADLRAYERDLRAGDAMQAGQALDRLVRRARAWSAAGEGRRALALVKELGTIDPFDPGLRLLESELLQQQGQLVQAMEPLLAVLAQGADPDGRAREQLRRLIDVHEIQLANRRDQAGLVRFFEDLVLRDPVWDGHRVRLARWLLEVGRVDDAQEVALQIGSVGASDAAREDLLAEIALARDGLPLEQTPRGLQVRAVIHGRGARLLVDTGASTTVLSAGLAGTLGSERLRTGVEVRTAGGVVQGELHRIRDLRIGGLRLVDLDVLVLGEVPADVDGLLGMDVLGRIPARLLPATLLGRSPTSG